MEVVPDLIYIIICKVKEQIHLFGNIILNVMLEKHYGKIIEKEQINKQTYLLMLFGHR